MMLALAPGVLLSTGFLRHPSSKARARAEVAFLIGAALARK
jgi:hypothetical protein